MPIEDFSFTRQSVVRIGRAVKHVERSIGMDQLQGVPVAQEARDNRSVAVRIVGDYDPANQRFPAVIVWRAENDTTTTTSSSSTTTSTTTTTTLPPCPKWPALFERPFDAWLLIKESDYLAREIEV